MLNQKNLASKLKYFSVTKGGDMCSKREDWGLGPSEYGCSDDSYGNDDRQSDGEYSEPQLTREEYLRQKREAEYRRDNYLRCRDCGFEWDLNRGSYCEKCGQKYGEKKKRKVEIIVCPKCGERDRSENFCTRCGTRTQSDTKLVD